MSLDSRLRTELHEIAADVDPSIHAALRSVLAARDRRRRRGRTGRTLQLVAAACLVLVAGVIAWRFTGARHDEVVVEPHPPSGTYQAAVRGQGAGVWRLRFVDDRMSLVAPDPTVLGSRVASGTYEVHDSTLSTDLLAEKCGGPGRYTWSGPELTLRVAKDDCALRVRLLTGRPWSRITGQLLSPATYGTPPLSLDRMRAAALAEGFRVKDVNAYLDEQYAGARRVIYTLETQGGVWTAYAAVDGGAPMAVWSGAYTLTDAATAVAGEPPCGPITYDYRLTGDAVAFVMVHDPCTGAANIGELVAQTVLYESASFKRLE